MKNRIFLSTIVLAGLLVFSTNAQDIPRFEIGVIAGDPTGLSGKYWFDEFSAVDAAAGWSFADKNLNIHGDYLLHFSKPEVRNGILPIYIGLGAFIRTKKDSNVGARIPIGVEYLIKDIGVPLTFFAEGAPEIILIPNTKFGGSGGVGVRLAF